MSGKRTRKKRANASKVHIPAKQPPAETKAEALFVEPEPNAEEPELFAQEAMAIAQEPEETEPVAEAFVSLGIDEFFEISQIPPVQERLAETPIAGAEAFDAWDEPDGLVETGKRLTRAQRRAAKKAAKNDPCFQRNRAAQRAATRLAASHSVLLACILGGLAALCFFAICIAFSTDNFSLSMLGDWFGETFSWIKAQF